MEAPCTRHTALDLTPEFYSSIVRYGFEKITVISAEGLYLYLSDSITPMLGYDPAELLHTDPLMLIHEEDKTMTRDVLLSLATGLEKQVTLPPFRHRAKDGSWHWMSTIATNMLDNPAVQGIVTNSRDITATMEVMQQKRESQAYYKALYFANPDLVVTLSTNGRIEASNHAVHEVTGYTPEDAGSRYFIDYVLPSYQQECQQVFVKALQGKPSTFETCIRRKQGNECFMRVTVVPVVLDGQVKSIQCIAKDITSEKMANANVQAQARRFQNILEGITEAFLALDSQWRYSFGNSCFTRFLGRSMEDLLHRCIWEEYPWLIGSSFHQKCYEVASTGQSAVFDEEFCDAGATLRFRIYPFDGGVSVSFFDITSQLMAQEELRKLSLVASKTTNGVIITDSNGNIEWVNQAFEQVSGYTLQEIAGCRPSEILTSPEVDVATIEWVRRQLAQGIPVRREMPSFKKNGEKIWADISISPVLNEQGAITKHVYIHTDVTERKLDQERLLKTTEHLYLQNQDLQQFNYIVSHNLRAPVANLMGLSAVLQKLDRNGLRFETGLLNMEKSARRLDDVITDLNKILAVRSADSDGSREVVSLADVAGEVLQSMQHLIEHENVSVLLDLAPDHAIWANRAYAYSVLHNLISNAIKYKSSHRDLLIELTSVSNDRDLYLRVKDNGSGMDLAVVKADLFQLYKRFHTGQDGNGIGLYLVKMQVEAMGGKIEVESQPEVGTTFILQFERTNYGQPSFHH